MHIVKTAITWMVVFIAYTYLIYQLTTMDWTLLDGVKNWWWLIPCVALMPLNILLEAVKWRYLLRDLYPMSLMEAQRQVYYGFVGAFITPYRAGDYPARVSLMQDRTHWAKAIAMGVYGSAVLTAVIVLSGLGPFWGYMSGVEVRPWFCLLSFVVLLVPRVTRVAEYSMMRYMVFGVQMYLMLRLLGVEISPTEALGRIPYYYLLVTVTPNIPVSDPAIRGSWAIIAFGPMGAIAALGLWLINTALPMVVGGVYSLKRK